MASKQARAVREHRERLKRDPDRDAATRVALRERLGAPRPRGFKELLAACPLGDLELDRSRDPGRDIDHVIREAVTRVQDLHTSVRRNVELSGERGFEPGDI